MSEQKTDSGQFFYDKAFRRHKLYSTIIAHADLCPTQDRAEDEMDLREEVGMFLASNSGIDPQRASKYAEELVPYYNNYAEGCQTGTVAKNLFPKLLATTLLFQGSNGNFDRFNEISDVHAALVGVKTFPADTGELTEEQTLSDMIRIEMAKQAGLQAVVLEGVDRGEDQKTNFKKTLRRLVSTDLIEYDAAKKISKQANCGRLWSLDAWLRSK